MKRIPAYLYRRGGEAPTGKTRKQKMLDQKRLKGRGCRRHSGVMPRRGRGRTTQSKR